MLSNRGPGWFLDLASLRLAASDAFRVVFVMVTNVVLTVSCRRLWLMH